MQVEDQFKETDATTPSDTHKRFSGTAGLTGTSLDLELPLEIEQTMQNQSSQRHYLNSGQKPRRHSSKHQRLLQAMQVRGVVFA